MRGDVVLNFGYSMEFSLLFSLFCRMHCFAGAREADHGNTVPMGAWEVFWMRIWSFGVA